MLAEGTVLFWNSELIWAVILYWQYFRSLCVQIPSAKSDTINALPSYGPARASLGVPSV